MNLLSFFNRDASNQNCLTAFATASRRIKGIHWKSVLLLFKPLNICFKVEFDGYWFHNLCVHRLRYLVTIGSSTKFATTFLYIFLAYSFSKYDILQLQTPLRMRHFWCLIKYNNSSSLFLAECFFSSDMAGQLVNFVSFIVRWFSWIMFPTYS
jgi:hypothetical protein